MIHGKRILVVVPARGGSKGIRLKNIQQVNGRPLVALVADVVKQIPEIDRAVVSTDSEEIAGVAKAAGLDVPFYRPESLSGDRIADWDVLVHALQACEELDKVQYDIVVMLQPTSPMRTATQVLNCIKMLVDEARDSVWTVSETDSKAHPLKQLRVSDGDMSYYDPQGGQVIARQQLGTVYHRNGIAYAITRQCLLEQKSIKGENAGALIIKEQTVNIDTVWDLKLANFVMSLKPEDW
jgi:CMP-N,N'-diacetyllegionaminic acid synthase